MFCDRQSLAALVKGAAFKKAVEKVPDHIWPMDEGQLCKEINLTSIDISLKSSFWRLVGQSQEFGGRINPGKIYEGICSSAHWFNGILDNPLKLAWILHPIVKFELAVEAMVPQAINRIHEIMEMSFYDQDGKVNYKTCNLVLKVCNSMLDRKPITNYAKQETQRSAYIFEDPDEAMNRIDQELATLREEHNKNS